MSITMFSCLACSSTVATPTPPSFSCSCGQRLWTPVLSRPAAERLRDGARRGQRADQLVRAQTHLTTCPVSGVRYGSGALILLYGPSGGGKTILAMKMAARQPHAVTFASFELGVGPTAARALRLSGLGARSDAEVFGEIGVGELLGYAQRGNVLIIDSMQMCSLVARDYRSLATSGATMVLVVCQVLKARGRDGASTFAGSNTIMHECDIAVEVREDRTFIIRKSRYEEAGRTGSTRIDAVPLAGEDSEGDADNVIDISGRS